MMLRSSSCFCIKGAGFEKTGNIMDTYDGFEVSFYFCGSQECRDMEKGDCPECGPLYGQAEHGDKEIDGGYDQ